MEALCTFTYCSRYLLTRSKTSIGRYEVTTDFATSDRKVRHRPDLGPPTESLESTFLSLRSLDLCNHDLARDAMLESCPESIRIDVKSTNIYAPLKRKMSYFCQTERGTRILHPMLHRPYVRSRDAEIILSAE